MMEKTSSSTHSLPNSIPHEPLTTNTRDSELTSARRKRFWLILLGLPLFFFLSGLSYRHRIENWISHRHHLDVSSSSHPPCAKSATTAVVHLRPSSVHSKRAPKSSHPQNGAAAVQAAPPVPSSTPAIPNPFPQPFDTSIQQNFSTTSCQNFFLSMLSDQNFRSCRAFSLLLATSQALVEAQTNGTLLNNIIWGTCNTSIDETTCTKNMNGFASQLQASCSTELSNRNANAVTTLQLLQSYDMMRNAGCLTDQTTNSYCYVEAALASNPVDLYFYQLPLGISLPKSVTPNCSPCTKSLLALYANALNSSPLGSELTMLSSAYRSAASTAQATCGPTYATTIAGSPATKVLLSVSSVILGLALSFWILL